MAAANGHPDPSTVAVATQIANQTALLAALLAEVRSDTENLAVGSMDGQSLMLDNFPVAGSRRIVIDRNGSGGDFTLVANVPTLLVPANEARLGGTVCNYGAGLAKLYLCRLGDVQDAQMIAKPTLVLPSGGAWDFTLSRLLWCGGVIAVAAGATSLTVAEV